MTAIWGHGGASAAHPMNTIDAFADAVRQGAAGTELDVRRSGDRALVVHHDAELADGRRIMDVEARDLPSHIPLLPAVLDACAGLEVVNVEIKNVEVDVDFDPDQYLARAVVDLVHERAQADPTGPRILVSCFSLATIDRVKALDPELPTGYLASARWDQLEALQRAVDGGHDAFHPYHLVVNADLVKAAHDAGLTVNTWTADDPDRVRWLAFECGVDAVITNTPDVALAALAAG
jgi:glycerophosphoryl diester phosphodiesterase